MSNTKKQETPEKKIPVLIMLPGKYKALLQKLADTEHRSAKAQAEMIVMRSLESAEVQELAAANQ